MRIDVALISDRLWRRRFGADPGVIGKTITVGLGGRTRGQRLVEIIGVLPPRFQFTYPEETELWLPLTWPTIENEPDFALLYRAVGRLRHDTSLAVAESAMQAFRDPADRTSRGPARIWLEPMHDYATGASRSALVLVSALTLLVLLSGAVNAATVFTASTVSRVSEMRVRRTLGASKRRLVRQILTEAALVAVIAGGIGLATLILALPMLRGLLPAGLPGVEGIRLNWLTGASVSASVMLSTLIAGTIPAWLSVRGRDHTQREDAHTATASLAGTRLRSLLLAVQFMLVSGLLIAGGMLARSFWNVTHVNRGFEASTNVYAAEIQLMHQAYRDQSFSRFERELLRRVRALTYVDAASLTSAIPLRGTDFVRRIRGSDGQPLSVHVRNVDPAYFDVMRIPLLSGRWLTEGDSLGSQWVALVSESLAKALYPGENPLGKFLEGSSGTQIVGVVADVRSRSLSERPTPAYYWPRGLQTTNQVWILVRSEMGAQQVAADLRQIVREVYPQQPIQRFAALAEVLDDSVADRRVYAVISSAFALAMLLLSGLGLCGHLSHVVAERARDLAIRSALGASVRHQRILLVRHVVPALFGGITVASLTVASLHPLLSPFLFEIDRFDGISLSVSAFLITCFTTAAVLVPARRLSKLDAAATLRAS